MNIGDEAFLCVPLHSQLKENPDFANSDKKQKKICFEIIANPFVKIHTAHSEKQVKIYEEAFKTQN